jgi:hypothetical protein
MQHRISLIVSIAAVVIAVVATAAPGVAQGVLAVAGLNADMVDGRHAVGFGASVDNRKAKLVATNAVTGRLPNNIIAKAPDADMVDGHHANGLTRVAMTATSDTLDLGTGEQTYGTTLTITAPGDGFVVVYGSMTVRNNGCTTGCTVLSRIRHIETGTYSVSAEETVPSGARNGNIANASVFPVSAGENRFDIRASRLFAGDGTLQGWFAELTAIYSPFGSTGTPPDGKTGADPETTSSTKDLADETPVTTPTG